MFDIKENLKKLPDCPGVYIHKDRLGQVIYVGKAISLKNRVRQYFQSSRNMDPKVRAMVGHIAEFEYIRCESEMEAFILECNLIKQYKPKYNILLRDDKTYPYIKVTMGEDWPRVVKTRIVSKDGGRYFGPFSDVGAVNQMVDFLNSIYRLKRCSRTSFPKGHRPCLNHHIGRCDGICIGKADHDDYMKRIDSVLDYLKGRNKNIETYLRSKMQQAAERLDYEEAAVYRDYLASAAALHQAQRVVLHTDKDMDVVISVGEEHIVSFFIRSGKLIGRESYTFRLPASEQDMQGSGAELIMEFLRQHYGSMSDGPGEILLEKDIPQKEMIEAYLSGIWGRNVSLHVPRRGEKRAVLEMALKDAKVMADQIKEKEAGRTERRQRLSYEMKTVLAEAGYEAAEQSDGAADKMKGPYKDYRIESFDISNTNGLDTVAGMVVFDGLEKDKKAYRRFRIRTAEGPDDYLSMKEVIYRRFKRLKEGDDGFAKMPDALLIDGGRGHVSAVLEVLNAMNIEVPVLGMVKDDHHRTRGLVYMKNDEFHEIDLRRRPFLFKYLGTVQEEVHRFSIEYHRGLRDRGKLHSVLDEIEGIGPVRRNALLGHFGSIENIRNAEISELAKVPGITEKAARAVYEKFHN